ncbi:hypothetical protein QVD17_17916 [Tagetes erecta]|uniref:Integrase catalytic domain-containing protein n=1 Tax=Tagetes erecta TaxID=13708 RepID=A0AAD8KGT5_TARER|nr:hypothetical protein QVD17_17916 [Tagetes erecta]
MGDKHDNVVSIPEATLISKLDASDLLYLHPSDSSSLTIISIKLKGTENYSVWANAIKLALRAKNKMGFIDKTCKKPTDDNVLANQWDRCNSVVLTWLLNSVSEELYVGQVYSELASDVWDDLNETYNKIDGSVMFSLYQKINSVTQNGSSVSDYYHRINTMWKQFDAMIHLPSCTCQASKEFNDFNQLIKLMQFLMGLDDIYQPVRTNLLTRDPLPTIKTAFSIISREESHRGAHASSKGQNVGYVSKSNQFYDTKRKNNSNFKGPNPNLSCTHCNKLGHTVDRCFELVGYPQSNKPRFGQGSNTNQINKPAQSSKPGNSSVQSRTGQSVSSSNNATLPGLTSEQIARLVGILNEKPADTQSNNIGGNFLNGFSANVFGKRIFNFASGNDSSLSGWIIDSGANQHMVMSEENLIDQIDVSGYNITVNHPNGTNALVTKIGSLKICDKIILTDVFVVPEYCANLISVYKLARDNKLQVVFDEFKCLLQDLRTRKTLVTGNQVEGLYLCGSMLKPIKVCSSSYNGLNLWHSRLGHPSDNALAVIKNSLGIKTQSELSPCETCHRAKQHRVPFPLSDHKSKNIGDLVHLDVWGPYKVQSCDGFKYFLTIVDDYSRVVWVYLLKNKTEVFQNIENYFYMLKTQFNATVKVFRSDNGTEFVNNQMHNFLNNNGVLHQTSCSYTPQQNGVVERKHRHLLNVARSLLFQGGLPLRFWSECVLTACYLINRTPTLVLNGKTPYEMFFGFSPSLDHLRVFGCLCFCTILNNSDKFSSHAEKCVMVGYSNQKKGYKLWSLDNKQVIFSRDVKFYENIFPFKDTNNSQLLKEHETFRMTALNFFDLFDTTQSKNSDGENPDDDGRELRDKIGSGQAQSIDTETVDGVVSRQQPLNGGGGEDTAAQKQTSSNSINTSEVDNADTIINNDKNIPPEGFNDPSTPLRKSNRHTSIPKNLNDFVIEGKVKYGFEKVVHYSKLSAENHCFATTLNKSVEPKSSKEALKDINWVNAMNKEMEALNRNKTWDLVDLPPGRKPIGCKWVFKIKHDPSGAISRYKARLVAKGYSQREGIDFDETFSPVVKMVTIRTVFSLAVQHNWPLYQLDVDNAFLYGDLNEEVYMKPPEGYYSPTETRVCKLNRSLYGLKQASRMWNEKLVGVLVDYGFVQSKCDHSLFIRRSGSIIVMALVYVDDIIITGNSLNEITAVKQLMNSQFMIKDLGLLKYFLGIEVIRTDEGLCLSQRKYCMELLTEYGLSGCKPAKTPIEQHYNVINFCKTHPTLLINVSGYQQLLGKLIYLSHTRPDISYAVQYLSQFMHQPTEAHLQLAMRVLRYLKGAPGKGLFFAPNESFKLSAYSDSDWGKCLETRRSVTGYCVMLGTCLVSWKSKKQLTVSRSSAEAEYRAMCAATCEVIWLKNLLVEMGIHVDLPVDMHCDNNAAISIAANPVFHDRTKHFDMDLYFLREKVSAGVIRTVSIQSVEQLADVFTKGLPVNQHTTMIQRLRMFDAFGI